MSFTISNQNVVQKPNPLTSPSRLNTDAVYTTWQNPNLPAPSAGDTFVTLMQLNDNHRKVKGLMKFKTPFDQITSQVKAAGSDLIKMHSGDYNVGKDAKKLEFQIEMLNDLGINFAALGNHEMDIEPQQLAKELEKAKFVSLSANLITPQGSGLDKLVETGKLVSSTIHTTPNGNKYGMVGLSPHDMMKRIDPNAKMYGVNVLDEPQTIAKVQEEVSKLKAQGINKIILVSHVGYSVDKKIAEQTDGIDIIMGGHSHDLLDPLETGVSLLQSKSNEPVLIFQNGKNAKFFGVTDATFDQNGIVKSAISRQERASNFEPNPKMIEIEEKVLGKSPVIGVMADTYSSSNVKMKENAIANFIADAVRKKTGAEIALFQSFAVRDTFDKGSIRARDVDEVFPFIDAIHLLQISGQDVVDALTNGANTYMREDRRPGILQVSGLKYTISPQGQAVNVLVEQPNGQYTPIDPNKEYKVAYDQFLVKGAEGFSSLAQPRSVLKAYYDANCDIAKDAIKALNFQPIEMKTEDRIIVQAIDPITKKQKPKAYQREAKTEAQPVQQQQVNNQPVAQPVAQQQQVPQPIQPRVAYQMPVYSYPVAPIYNYPPAPVYYPAQQPYNPYMQAPQASPFLKTR